MIAKRFLQRVPHSGLDGSAKHSVYATGRQRTKHRARVIAVQVTRIGRFFRSLRCMRLPIGELSSNKKPWLFAATRAESCDFLGLVRI